MPGGRLARMRGGPRQIQQESQRRGGGGGPVINKSAHKEGGGLFDFLFLF